MTQSTDIQRFTLSPAVYEEALRLGDPRAQRLRGVGIRVGFHAETGEPWFVARDVCEILDIQNPSDAVNRLDDDQYEQVAAALVSTEARPQDRMLILSESGLYSLILGSRKPVTRPFRRWVTDQVLPAIRKTGRYVEPAAPKSRVELARELLAAEERAEEAEKTAAEQRELLHRAHGMLKAVEPKVEAFDVFMGTDRDWSMRDAAMILNRDPAIMTTYRLGQNLLHWYMLGERELTNGAKLKMLDRNGRIYADHKTHLVLRLSQYDHPHTGEPRASEQVRVTPQGLLYLQRRFSGGGAELLQMDTPVESGKDMRPLPKWAQ